MLLLFFNKNTSMYEFFGFLKVLMISRATGRHYMNLVIFGGLGILKRKWLFVPGVANT